MHYNNLQDAIKNADIKEVQRLVQQGCPINSIDPKYKFAPIHWAVHYGAIECLHWLLWHGADFHIQSTEGWTPAHVGAIRGRDICLQSLAANGMNMNIVDSRGKNPAHLACSHGNTKSLQEILRKGVDNDARDSMGWCLTHTAAYHGRLGCLQILNKWGFDMKSLDSNGNSLAHLAAGEGHVLCVKFLVSITNKAESLIKARNNQGDTPKDTAAHFHKKKCVEYLEAIEYDVEHPESSENLAYPAHNSAYNGDLEFLQMALETGVALINDRDERGSTPAHKAAGNGRLEVLKWLMERGANMTILNAAGENVRDVALRFGHLHCAKLIGGDSDFEDDEECGEKEVIDKGPQSKADARARAERKVEELKEQLQIAKLNFQHLGGELPEDGQRIKEQQEHQRVRRELEEQLEYERVRREKLECQMDAMRLQIHNLTKEVEASRQQLIIPRPPSSDRTKLSAEPLTKNSPTVPKTKKKTRRVRPKSGVLLVQRTPGYYEPLSTATRSAMSPPSSNILDGGLDGRPKTAFREIKGKKDEASVVSGSVPSVPSLELSGSRRDGDSEVDNGSDVGLSFSRDDSEISDGRKSTSLPLERRGSSKSDVDVSVGDGHNSDESYKSSKSSHGSDSNG